ncbi:type 1 glutamine amidotransferase domain-containing protein [Planococcus salinarum]|uniref:type 1 glutamine amidotransferase domain-containing protein n=1 Tax=Planococcus salinarum TaxID=622695 RepID=UPI000E3C6228|nr:type 1 glutamine amidotransferase domain-containing protein [Planococcus salinarum]TAA72585.1 type 1 glutamine amidotransferase domain-containing protein [Planococcus salinarum]
MQKILVVVTNNSRLGENGKKTGLWLRELTDFYHEVKDRYGVDIVSTAADRVPIDPRSLVAAVTHKQTRHYYMDDDFMVQLKKPLVPEQVDAENYAAIYFTGGHGTMMDFPDNTALQELTRDIYEQGGYVSAVCHGPSGLQNVRLSNGRLLLAGHVVTGFSDTEEKAAGMFKHIPFSLEQILKDRGGLYKKASVPMAACTVVSGRLVTGQNPASARGVALKLLDQLEATKQV